MKTKLASLSAIAAAIFIAAASFNQPTQAQTGAAQAPGTPPIGKLVEITLSPWSYGQTITSTSEIKPVQGRLLGITDRWVIIEEGSMENWVPMDRIVVMRVTKR